MSIEDQQASPKSGLVHELDRLLPDGFPLPEHIEYEPGLLRRVGVAGWLGYNPPEDSAVEPRLDWTEAHRMLVLASYRKKWERFLEPHHEYDITWPPAAGLWSDGHVYTVDVCVRHQDAECGDCTDFVQVDLEVEPAEWRWYVTIETLEHEGDHSSVVDEERFQIMTTYLDPWQVDYHWQ